MKTQIIDVSTGEEIVRDMTKEELSQLQEDRNGFEAAILAENIRLQAKEKAQAKLAALGLSLDDLAALGL